MNKYRFEGKLLIPDNFKCSGGKGLCPNDAECVVATESERRGNPLTQRRFLCKRCLIGWVQRNIASKCFELPKWVERLVGINEQTIGQGGS